MRIEHAIVIGTITIGIVFVASITAIAICSKMEKVTEINLGIEIWEANAKLSVIDKSQSLTNTIKTK